MTGPTLKVLGCLIQRAGGRGLSGAEITKATKVGAGTLYPMIVRLEAAGWVTGEWEELLPQELGRPRRRYYSITALGVQKGRAAYDEIAPAFGRPAWA